MEKEIECLPPNRKYQTLNSIPKESEDYKFFKFYIELEEKMFSFYSTQKTENQQEEMIKTILSIFETIKENKNFSQYFVDLLVYYILIRPKQIEITCSLLSILLSNNKNMQIFINETIQNNRFLQDNYFVQNILYSQGIIESEPKIFVNRKNTVFSIYEKGSLEFILKENDVNSLKEYVQRNNTIKKDQAICIDTKSQFSLICDEIRFGHSPSSLKLLDFCSFYSSFECFQFLQTNGFQYGDSINKLSVAGGNFPIIHELEQNGISFDFCFKRSVQYHQLNVIEWLLTNYKCEIISLALQIECCDYKTLFYMFLNNIDINKGNPTLLYALCEQKEINIELIKYFIEHGADVNIEYKKGFETYSTKTPFLSICRQNEINVELIKYFLEHGADINKGNPLLLLCSKKEVNVELIKIFVENGADVNKLHKDDNKNMTTTPFFVLCTHEKINCELIKYFIAHGANINKECVHQVEQITPLTALCRQKEINIELINYFIEQGADINKGNPTPLYALCHRKEINIELIKYFIAHGSDFNKEYKNGFGYSFTPLSALCQQKEINIELINYFIEQGADINKGSLTPLYSLCQQKELNIELIKYFIAHGSDVNKGNQTPLTALCEHTEVNIEHIRFFIELGADVNKGDITPLFALCQQKQINVELIKYFIELGADVNKDCKILGGSLTPLLSLCSKNNVELIKYFIEHGADVNKGNKHNIPLYALCRQKEINFELINYFIEHGADVNKEFEDAHSNKISLLIALCQQNEINDELVKYLIDHGADVNKNYRDEFKNKVIITPLYALKHKKGVSAELIDYFIKHGAKAQYIIGSYIIH